MSDDSKVRPPSSAHVWSNKLQTLVARIPFWIKGIVAVWFGIALLFSSFDELQTNIPPWFRIFIGIPAVAFVLAIALCTTLIGGRALAQKPPRAPGGEEATEEDPVGLYRNGIISHPEMMARLQRRRFENSMGCSLALRVMFAGLLGIFLLLPREPEGSINAASANLAVGACGTVCAFLLWRGIRRRPWRWALLIFLAFAAVWVSLALLSYALN